MATVTIATRTRKNGKSYIVQYADPITREKRYHGTFRSKREADAERSRLKNLLNGGDTPVPLKEKSAARTMTLNDIAGDLEKEWDRKGLAKSLSQATVKGYKHFLAPLKKEIGKTLLVAITEQSILDYLASVADSQSAALSNRRLFILKQLFGAATKKGCVREDFVSKIRYLDESRHVRKRYLNPNQLSELLLCANEGGARQYLPLAILLATEHGCSRQEILDLLWSDIDLNMMGGIISFYRTKNKTDRCHKLMPRTKQALLDRLAYLKKRGRFSPEGRVVGRPDGSRLGDFDKAWKSACEKCGLKNFHFHDNRHTFCTNAVLSGVSLKETSVLIGHHSPRMTDRYANLESLQDSVALQKLAGWYQKPAGTNDTDT